MQNYTRLLITVKQYSKAVVFLKRNLEKISLREKEKILEDISSRLLKKNKYRHITQLIPPYFKNQKSLLNRIQALGKLKIKGRKKEASYYLKNFNKYSNISERVFFQVCLRYLKRNKKKHAKKCLEELREDTIQAPSGGRSRYFLASLLKKEGKPLKAKEMLREIYLNSPSHYFVFKSLKKSFSNKKEPLPQNNADVRKWLAQQAGNPEQLKLFFKKKNEKKGFGIDPFWISWEKKLIELDKKLSNSQKKGALFLGMGQPRIARDYLSTLQEEEKYLTYQRVGYLIKDPYLSYNYLRKYLQKVNKDIDIFFLSPLAEKILYPVPYIDLIQEASQRFSLQKAALYALIKQESAFHSGARSGKGATGIMQVMPRIGRAINRTLKIKKLDLKNPRHSILIGSKFYLDMQKVCKGIFEHIMIAYNAGLGRLFRWKKQYPLNDFDIFLEYIPFSQTNLYVKETRRYYDRYKVLFKYQRL